MQLLGGANARLSERWQPFVPDKRYQLLAYLAYQGDWVSRDKLAFLFWPDTESSRAKENLRGLLKRVHALEWITNLETDNRRLRWQVKTDVAVFRKALEEQRLDEAVSLYSGPLLAGMETDEAAEFSEWLELERERFYSSWREAVFGRMRELEEAGRDKEAATLLSRLLREDELDEEALRAYMAAAARAGQVQEALRAYGDFAKRLDRELGMEPTSTTQQLKERSQELEVTNVNEDTLVPPSAAPATTDTLPSPRSLIPASATSFVGRNAELAEIAYLLSKSDCRLLTLTGPGGIGKTRLALQVARELEASYQDGVYFVPLDSLSALEAIPAIIAQALGLSLQGPEDPLLQISRYIQEKHILLVLDNFEQLLEGATLVFHLLQCSPKLKVLITSRERLNLAEEWLLNIEGLALPKDEKESQTSDAVALFVQRATQVLPSFAATEENLSDIIRICRLVQGSPLAIELAAVWVRLMSVSEIAHEIETNLDLLSTSARNIPERQRSIRATFEYSWGLLSPKEQEALRKLSVFRGGFTREAAMMVAGVPVAVLAALLDKSLLRITKSGRYDRHPLLYQFTQEKLAEHSEELEQMQERHGRYFHAFLAQQEADKNQKQALEKVEAELENITIAWQWAVAGQRVRELHQAADFLIDFYRFRTRLGEGRELFAQAIAALSEHEPSHQATLGFLLACQATNNYRLRNYETSRLQAKHSLALLQPHDDVRGTRYALNALARVALAAGEYAEARQRFEELLAFVRERGEPKDIASPLHNLGVVENAMGDYAQAKRHYEEALSVHRQYGEHALATHNLTFLGEVLLNLDKPKEALSVLQEGLALAQETGAQYFDPLLFANLANTYLALGELPLARERCQEVLEVPLQGWNHVSRISALLTLGRVAIGLGDVAQAEAHLKQGLEIAWSTQEPALILDSLVAMAELHLIRERMDEAAKLTSFVAHHPKAEYAVRARAGEILVDINGRLGNEMSAQLENGKSLEEVIGAILQRK